MCWVMPPASFSATRVLRMASSSEVLPWSTWPMTVTTGGRGLSWVGSVSSSSSTSPSSERTSTSKLNLSATSLAAVGSSTSLRVAMTPSSTSALITSPDFRRMAAASSPTVTDSGSLMSSRLTSAGGSGLGSGALTAVGGGASGAGGAGAAGGGGGGGAGGRGCGARRLGHRRRGTRGLAHRRGTHGLAGRRRAGRLERRRRGRARQGRRGRDLGLLDLDHRGPRGRLAGGLGLDGDIPGLTLDGRGLGLDDALGLGGLRRDLTSPPELHAQLIRRRGVERRHRALPLVAHAVEGQQEILAGDSQLLRQVNDLQTSRQCSSPLLRIARCFSISSTRCSGPLVGRRKAWSRRPLRRAAVRHSTVGHA